MAHDRYGSPRALPPDPLVVVAELRARAELWRELAKLARVATAALEQASREAGC